jgi:glycosyltransferase involved in cell wall biosynthesis
MMTASIIISSYNYAPYLRQAIDSALAQTHPATEVIVVDDGSSDESPQIIRSYGDRVRAILKSNGGQASSWNVGYEASRGDVILFLDSDDVLEANAVRCAVAAMTQSASKVHWPLRKIDESGQRLDQLVPSAKLSGGDLRDIVLRCGPRSEGYIWPPTSGNLWSRRFLRRVMPISESSYRTCPDLYLCAIAPLYGSVRAINEPLSLWRVHRQNHTGKDAFRARVHRYVKLWEDCCDDLEQHAHRLNLMPNPARWRRDSWWHRLERASGDLDRILPREEPFVLVDDETWGCAELGARAVMPLLAQRGAPENDDHALAELRSRRDQGARHLVITWPSFWWLDHYAQLARYLRERCRCVADHDDFVAFELAVESGTHA